MTSTEEMKNIVKELRNAAASINIATDKLYQQFSVAIDNTDQEPDRIVKPEIKLEDVRAVLADKSRLGYTAEVRSLLLKHGADRLSKIDPANYEALMCDVQEIGNGR